MRGYAARAAASSSTPPALDASSQEQWPGRLGTDDVAVRDDVQHPTAVVDDRDVVDPSLEHDLDRFKPERIRTDRHERPGHYLPKGPYGIASDRDDAPAQIRVRDDADAVASGIYDDDRPRVRLGHATGSLADGRFRPAGD